MTKALTLLLTFTVAAQAQTESDVLVYGATPGGFCAAIAAAREGATVILLEPTNHVGGVNTGGLSFSDSNQTVRSTVMGLFDEWHTRIEKHYQQRGIKLPYQVSVKDHTHWTYEPHVAALITNEMLKEAGVKVLTKQVLKEVQKDGPRIVQLITTQGKFKAKMFVDATYEGDLMAAAGVSWTIGREGRAAYGESLAGKQYPKAKMAISGIDDQGKPLPLITTTDAGPAEEGDANVMVYSFRLCVTENPANRVPFPAPANYDTARFELLRRSFRAEKNPGIRWDLYPLPNGKFDANNSIGGQFSLGLVGAANGWSEADQEGRAKIWEAHKQYTLEMYHFLTTDPSVPAALRRKYAALGLCRDEFPDYGHFSPQLYVREGRRMKGMYVVSQKDIMKDPAKDDAIVISSFPIDSHDCQRIALKDGVINEGTVFPVRVPGKPHGYAYHIPYRSIVPQEKECTNLLVPVALSCTHVAISSIRVEPTWMILGQSAGIAASLAAKREVSVQALPYPALRERLLAQKQVLDLPVIPAASAQPVVPKDIAVAKLPGIVLDDAKAELKGHWTRSTNFKPHVGAGYVHDDKRADGQSTATFRLKVPKTAKYDLRLAYSAHETRATKVPITVGNGKMKVELLADQTKPLPKDSLFRSVGTVTLSSEEETTITLSNQGTDGFVILDAIQLVEVGE